MFRRVLVALSLALFVRSESHTIRFQNNCGYGTPTLIQGTKVLSTGQDYTSSGPFSSGIAYLQTGFCQFNGENCTLVEMTLGNPTCPGCGSSVDLSLIPPHKFSVPTSFSYYGDCDGAGASCDNADCSAAFREPNNNQDQVQCEDDNVDLLITFCGTSGYTPPSTVSTHSSIMPSPSSSSSGVYSSKVSLPLPSSSNAHHPSPASFVVAPSTTSSTPFSTPTSYNDEDGYDECEDDYEDSYSTSTTFTSIPLSSSTYVPFIPLSSSTKMTELPKSSLPLPSSPIPTSSGTIKYVTVTETITVHDCSERPKHSHTSPTSVPTSVVPSNPVPSTTSPDSGNSDGNGHSSSKKPMHSHSRSPPGSVSSSYLSPWSSAFPPSSSALPSSFSFAPPPSSLPASSLSSNGVPPLSSPSSSWSGVSYPSSAVLPSLGSSYVPSASNPVPPSSSTSPIPSTSDSGNIPVPESDCIPDTVSTSLPKHRRVSLWSGHRRRLESDTY